MAVLRTASVNLKDLGSIRDPGEDLLYVPTAAALRPGDNTNIYVTTQAGLILRFNTDRGLFETKPFADFTSIVREMREAGRDFEKGKFTHLPFPQGFKDMGFSDERGLLGLAFDPRGGGLSYYIHLSKPTDRQEVDHYAEIIRVREDGERRTILRLAEPQFNHNGGHLAFDTAGYLYVGFGDGGGFNDEHGHHLPDGSHFGNAQDPTTWHGKILRVDVSEYRRTPKKTPSSELYRIPSDNPFVKKTVQDWPKSVRKYFGRTELKEEIWHLGLRNPWKFTWNPQNPREMFVADVGQNEVEEVNVIAAPKANLGWRAMEGNRIFNGPLKNLLDATGVCLRAPELTYSHEVGVAIIGGYVLARDSFLAQDMREILERSLSLEGGIRDDRMYVYGDYSGKIFVGFQRQNYEWESAQVFEFKDRNIHSFARDNQDRIYVLWTTAFGKSPSEEKRSGVSRIEVVVPETMASPIGSNTTTGRRREKRIENWNEYVVMRPPPPTGMPPRRLSRHLRPSLSDEDMRDIAARALKAAEETNSDFRWDVRMDKPGPARIWVAVRRRIDRRYHVVSTDDDVWEGSFQIAQNKAAAAMFYSSDENAMSTRSLKALSQPKPPDWEAPLWGLGTTTSGEERNVQFPGGFPLYKNGKMVGGVGVSGDAPNVDEIIALAATRGYEPPQAIRIDTRSKGRVPYSMLVFL